MIKNFNERLVDGHYIAKYGVGSSIKNEGDIQNLSRAFLLEVLTRFEVEKYYTLDRPSAISFLRSLSGVDDSSPRKKTHEELRQTLCELCARCVGVGKPLRVDDCVAKVPQIRKWLSAAFNGVDVGTLIETAESQDPEHMGGDRLGKNAMSEKEATRIIDHVQGVLNEKGAAVKAQIVSALEGTVRYERLELRKGPIDKGPYNSVLPPYFTEIKKTESVGEEEEISQPPSIFYLANNGWIMDWDASKNFSDLEFAAETYMSRRLVAWSDCVKLNFGTQYADCPVLYDRMATYCAITAQLFDGVRLDNCHSTPLHVGQFCLAAARKANPKLFVFAELFTGTGRCDFKFSKSLGLDALLREANQTTSPADLAEHVRLYGTPVAPCSSASPLALDSALQRHADPVLLTLGQRLRPSKPVNLFYDCTHDNPTLVEKNRPRDALPLAALLAASNAMSGSTYGYEYSVKANPSVFSDGKLYEALKIADDATKDQENIASADNVNDLTESATKDLEKSDAYDAGKNLSVRSFPLSVHKIEIFGSFNNWSGGLTLDRKNDANSSNAVFFVPIKSLTANLPAHGTFTAKFRLDDKDWTCAKDFPTVFDDKGNENNLIEFDLSASQCVHTLKVGLERLQSRSDQLYVFVRSIHDVPGGKSDTPATDLNVNLSKSVGLIEARRILNRLHILLSSDGTFTETNIKHLGNDVALVIRRSPVLGVSAIFIVRSAWNHADGQDVHTEVEGELAGVVLSAQMRHEKEVVDASEWQGSCEPLKRPAHWTYSAATDRTRIQLPSFETSSVFVALCAERTGVDDFLSVWRATAALTFPDLSALVWSCEAEEKDRSMGKDSIYKFPGCKIDDTVFGGLAGTLDAMSAECESAIDANVSAGSWLLDYHSNRLHQQLTQEAPSSNQLINAYKRVAEGLKLLEGNERVSSVKAFFVGWTRAAFRTILEKAQKERDNDTSDSSGSMTLMTRRLHLAASQLLSQIRSASLDPKRITPTLSAGLPFFASEYMREWGRDTFLALPGLLIEAASADGLSHARQEILAYAKVVRHAQIPNLLDSGNNPRYNARDAVWFWLLAIRRYCEATQSLELLEERVELKYPNQDQGLSFSVQTTQIQNLRGLIHYILSAHYFGIRFREWNAGLKIDAQMKDEGFNVHIQTCPKTGFIFGGNTHNCGTWMDKMGSSEKAGNKGVPATPRNGAPVELTCALFSILTWITSPSFSQHLSSAVSHPSIPGLEKETMERLAPGETDGSGASPILSYQEWRERIAAHFLDNYLVTEKDLQSESGSGSRAASVAGALKDTVGGNDDIALRCNYSVGLSFLSREEISALSSRPDSPDSLRPFVRALEIAREYLITEPHQVGMKTTAALDGRFNPNYDNADDSHDPLVAHGFNYHLGPEWVWPFGCWLQAAHCLGLARDQILPLTIPAQKWIAKRPWYSLPELMDSNGRYCHFSCQSQAWSIATLLSFFLRI